MKNIVVVFSCVFLSLTAIAQPGIDYKSPPKPYVPGGQAEPVDTKPGFALRARSSPEQIAKAVEKKAAAVALKAAQVKRNKEIIAARRSAMAKYKGPNCGIGRTASSVGGWCKSG